MYWEEEETVESIYRATGDDVKLLGRTAQQKGILWCAFSGTGAEFVVRGTALYVEIYGDSTVTDPENQARLGIYVDEKRVTDVMVAEQRKVYPIYEASETEVHVIRIIKLSESAMSTIGIGEIRVENGSILPTANRRFLIEFVGDSITCGYGVDDEDENHQFSTRTEDVTKAFAYRTAKELDVDYSCVSFSGYGVFSGYSGDGMRNDKELLPPHYEKTGFSYAKSGLSGSEFCIGDIPWDFSRRQPDVVFVNLGTNDASYCGEDPERQEQYQQCYISLLKNIHKNNPGAYLVCGLGIMGDVLYPALCAAVERYKAETGNVRIETVYFEAIRPETEGYAANYHPTARTHIRACGVLAGKLKEVFKKQYGANVGERVAALTFDDGPNVETTPKVLEKLQIHEIPGSFFLVGKNISPESTQVVKTAVKQGCEIENHSITHSVMSGMDIDAVLEEIEKDNVQIREITGTDPAFFRPPYIAVSPEMCEAVPLPMIAGYGAEDWEESVTASMRAQRVLSQLRDGVIILLHDAAGNQMTVDALDTIITLSKKQGYRFVTVRDLFKEKDVTPVKGVVYNEAV